MNDLENILNEINRFLEEITSVERTKFEATLKNDVIVVEECMNQEQAFLLKLKGLDKKRESIQKNLGYENMTFREIVNEIPKESKEKFEVLFDKMQSNLNLYKEISKTAQSALEDTIKKIDIHLSNLKAKQSSKNVVYNQTGNIVSKKNSFTSKKI